MEIIKKFGLETNLFLFQLANFLIIAFILKKFLFKPLKKMLDERKRIVDQSLQDAQDARAALENAGQERDKILTSAKTDADALAVAAKASLEETKIKLTDDAKKRSQQIVDDAKQKAAAEFENLNKQIGKISADISGKLVSKVLSDLFTGDEKQKVISRALDKIEEYEKNPN
ncbi:ATP synthase F0 subunit B [Endomicrobium proavitum]|uniref:ATP synthase subunit b n=1 Tax=Endomicrobium proavitum TaxID=1408281 RepID=A0A0G3WH51_9BACT|nr:ATP synthase F0 subunit B [Endomicrobium proavitum]AKL97946.1 ATP synthase subunit b [Endomicrobium proavitum]